MTPFAPKFEKYDIYFFLSVFDDQGIASFRQNLL